MDIRNLDRVLTAHGYAIKKTSLTPRTVQKLRKDLTVAPIVAPKFAMAAQTPFAVYTESPSRFYVPRAWAAETFGAPQAEAVPEGAALSDAAANFVGKPYDYQVAIIQTFIDKGANGLICVPCGRGKTFMALAIAARLGRRFLIVVDKEFLMNQWRGEITALLPGLRVGILQGDKLQTSVEEFDCTICMIQTLVQREFPEDTFRSYGFAIFDECHHLGAAHFSRALLKVQTKYMLGLSATPKRDDGLTKVFEWFLGKPVYWEKSREPDETVIVRCEQFTCDDAAYTEVPTDYRGEMIMGRLLTRVVECTERTRKIAQIIKEICADPNRRVLVLSERIGHLKSIEELLGTSGLTMSYYVGGMKEAVREEGAKTARVLLASYAMASEAMNIKTLNAVLLASPRKKVEQSTGRILRTRVSERVVAPLIVDIVDVHGVYQGMWKKRLAYYKKCAYKIVFGAQLEVMDSSDDDTATEQKGGCLIDDDDDKSE
jgi:superfamily II DNA or RNA helicase